MLKMAALSLVLEKKQRLLYTKVGKTIANAQNIKV
jgi:hypothetical protein